MADTVIHTIRIECGDRAAYDTYVARLDDYEPTPGQQVETLRNDEQSLVVEYRLTNTTG